MSIIKSFQQNLPPILLFFGLCFEGGSAVASEQLVLRDFLNFPHGVSDGEYVVKLSSFVGGEVQSIEGSNNFLIEVATYAKPRSFSTGLVPESGNCNDDAVYFTAPESIAKTIATEYSNKKVYLSNIYFDLSKTKGGCNIAEVNKIELLGYNFETEEFRVTRTLE